MQVDRPTYPLHTLATQPIGCRTQQRGEHSGIVLRLQHAKIPNAVSVLAQVHFINLGGDTAHHQTVPESQPGAPAGVLEEVVF